MYGVYSLNINHYPLLMFFKTYKLDIDCPPDSIMNTLNNQFQNCSAQDL